MNFCSSLCRLRPDLLRLWHLLCVSARPPGAGVVLVCGSLEESLACSCLIPLSLPSLF